MSDAARYKRVYANDWHDPRFRRLNDGARVVRFYVAAGPQTTSCGCFRLSTALAVEDLGGTPEAFEDLLATVCEAYEWAWNPLSRVVWIRDWFENNPPASPNVVASWAKLLRNVPPCDVRDEAVASIAASLKNLTPPYREPWAELSKSFRRTEVRPEVQPETNQVSGIRDSGIQGNREQARVARKAATNGKTTTKTGLTPDGRMLKFARQALELGDPNGDRRLLVDTFYSCKNASGVREDVHPDDAMAYVNLALAERRTGVTA